MQLVGQLLINVVALLVVAYIIPGFVLVNLKAAIVAAIVIGVVNTFIRPILQIIALPISILTLGIAAFFVNVFLLWGVSYVVPGFAIDGFLTATIASIVLSLTSAFLHKLAKS
jgi:putative membrane protein